MLSVVKEEQHIIIRHVRNVHGARNGLGIRITIEEVEKAEVQVRKSGPKVVKRLLIEWVPSSLTFINHEGPVRHTEDGFGVAH